MTNQCCPFYIQAVVCAMPIALSSACATSPASGTTVAPAAEAEAVSLFGEPLRPPSLGDSTRARYERQLAVARSAYEAHPTDADSIIWLGRRLAYLGRFRESIAVYTRGITTHPDDARLYRHRGHRYITTRQFERATADLERAARLVANRPDEIEPDGLPNARNVPTSTLQSNIWYHLGLARYLRGDFEGALDAYRRCLAVSTNADMLVATTHWLYMTLRRLGRLDEATRVLAPIRRDMDIIENDSYHRLTLLYKGELSVDSLGAAAGERAAIEDATVGYGIANWHYYSGRRQQAEDAWRRILAGGQWTAFGYIAAEADLKRLGASR